jgi:hypothetical protein
MRGEKNPRNKKSRPEGRLFYRTNPIIAWQPEPKRQQPEPKRQQPEQRPEPKRQQPEPKLQPEQQQPEQPCQRREQQLLLSYRKRPEQQQPAGMRSGETSSLFVL